MILFLGAHILDGFRPISLEIGIQHSDFAKNGPQTDRILYSGDVEDKATPLSASPPQPLGRKKEGDNSTTAGELVCFLKNENEMAVQ